MNPNKNVLDTLIIGQGLAGSLLAYRLIQRGQNVLVIDNAHHGSSSKVAAGIINPITGYRLTTNSLFAQQQSVSLSLYRELENVFQSKLLSELSQFRLLKSQEQSDYWQKRLKHPNYTDYVGKTYPSLAPFVNMDWGVVEIHQTLRIAVEALLAYCKDWLIAKDSYQTGQLSYADIDINGSRVKLHGHDAKTIVFCEGYQAIHNPWWQHLPFKLSKGEILKVELDTPITAMLNWRQWLVPDALDGTQALLGSNYAWGDFSTPESVEPSQEARDYLLMRLTTNTILKADVIDHKAGIRPTPTQRFPFVGPHTKHRNNYCFNGFGSKGCHTIPYYSQLLADHLIDQSPLPNEITQWL